LIESRSASNLGALTADPKKLYNIDLENAIVRTLWHEIATQRELKRYGVQAAVDFIETAKDLVPLNQNFTSILSSVIENLNKTTLSHEEMVLGLRNASLPPERRYEGCRGTRPGTRGYPCSLWMLMHSMTVNAYKRYQQDKTYDPIKTLHVIRNYIGTFFSCSWCQRHFMDMARRIEMEATKPEDAVLWLWRVHNTVNVRLAGTITDDPARPKVNFPSPALCKTCHKEGSTNAEPLWDLDEVLKFLLNFYSAENIV